MQLTRLTSDTEIAAFDCGDEDLNGFLLNDARAFRMLVSAEENPYTRSMYFDMMEMEK